MIESTPSERDPDETFRIATEIVEKWLSRSHDTHTRASDSLSRIIDDELNGGDVSPWDRDVIETRSGQDCCDVVINGAIGIKVVRGMTFDSISAFTQKLHILATQHTHLILVGYRLPRENIDSWRITATRVEPGDIGVDRFATVESFQEQSNESSEGDSSPLYSGLTRMPESLAIVFSFALAVVVLSTLTDWVSNVNIEIQMFFVGFIVLYGAVLVFAFLYIRQFD